MVGQKWSVNYFGRGGGGARPAAKSLSLGLTQAYPNYSRYMNTYLFSWSTITYIDGQEVMQLFLDIVVTNQ